MRVFSFFRILKEVFDLIITVFIFLSMVIIVLSAGGTILVGAIFRLVMLFGTSSMVSRATELLKSYPYVEETSYLSLFIVTINVIIFLIRFKFKNGENN